MENKLAGLVRGNTVIVCIGNPIRGDDGLGSLLANLLEGKAPIAVIDAGEVPESYTERIASLKPQTVILVDAMKFGGCPGDLAIFERNQLSNAGLFTHQLPLAIFMDYVKERTGANIFLIGVQPSSTRFGSDISPQARQAAEYLAECLERILIEKERT